MKNCNLNDGNILQGISDNFWYLGGGFEMFLIKNVDVSKIKVG